MCPQSIQLEKYVLTHLPLSSGKFDDFLMHVLNASDSYICFIL